MYIDYEKYMDGTLWPSESKSGTGDPVLMPVEAMAPQYAVGALHKLLRHAAEFSSTEHQEEQARARARNSVLGKALTSQAIGLRDFAPDDAMQQGVTFARLDEPGVARVMARGLLESLELQPMQAAQLAMNLAGYMSEHDYYLIQGD